ncbi:MAG: dihydropteroate synthase, partial [Myxococcales bacterium]
PVIDALASEGAVVSVDTMRAEVAAAAVGVGARIVNDVSGGLADEQMLATVAGLEAAYVAMHWRGHGSDMQTRASYDDIVPEVRDELDARVEAALAAGISAERLIIDPGLGFAKTADHNWTLLQHLGDLNPRRLPMLVGSSRKSFLGALLADDAGEPRPVLDREDANVALTALAAIEGAWAVRVHEVRASVDAVKVVERWLRREPSGATGRVDGDHE